MLNLRYPVAVQGRDDIFDLQTRAERDGLVEVQPDGTRVSLRIVAPDDWAPAPLRTPVTVADYPPCDEDVAVYRYSQCRRNPSGYAHHTIDFSTGRTHDRCVYCKHKLTV